MVSPGTKQKIFNCMSSPRKRKKVNKLVPINLLLLIDGRATIFIFTFFTFQFHFQHWCIFFAQIQPVVLAVLRWVVGHCRFRRFVPVHQGRGQSDRINRIESIGSNQQGRGQINQRNKINQIEQNKVGIDPTRPCMYTSHQNKTIQARVHPTPTVIRACLCIV